MRLGKREEVSSRENKFSKEYISLFLYFFLSLSPSLSSAVQVILATSEGKGRRDFVRQENRNTRDDFSFFVAHEIPTMDACHDVAAAFTAVFDVIRHTWRKIVP
jgi:hypothetical protein